jgi:ABC-type branched-subunit amino acid transport system substrate-binding protein
VAFQSGDNPQGKGGNALYQSIFEKRGAKVVYNKSDLPPVDPPTSYAAWVQAIMAAKPDIVYVSNNFPNEVGLTGALKAAGFKGMTVGFTTYTPGLLEKQPNVASAIEGHFINVQLPPQESGAPAIKQLQADLKSIGEPTDATFGVSQGYWQADLFIEMLKKGGTASGAAMKDTLNKGFTYTSEKEGGLGKLTFPENHDVSAPCAALVQVVKGSYEVKQPFSCYENLKLK